MHLDFFAAYIVARFILKTKANVWRAHIHDDELPIKTCLSVFLLFLYCIDLLQEFIESILFALGKHPKWTHYKSSSNGENLWAQFDWSNFIQLFHVFIHVLVFPSNKKRSHLILWTQFQEVINILKSKCFFSYAIDLNTVFKNANNAFSSLYYFYILTQIEFYCWELFECFVVAIVKVPLKAIIYLFYHTITANHFHFNRIN